jgi:hypothetical protein
MKFKALVVAMALLLVAGVSQAQFNCGLTDVTFPLTSSCEPGAGEPLVSPCGGTIYWDANNDGPDASDQPPVVGNGFGQCNFNTIDMNGADFVGVPGTWVTLETFTIATNTPQPSRYYVVVECAGVRWTSEVITINDGYSEVDLDEWSCQVTQQPCVPRDHVIETVGGRNFVATGPYYECLDFCANIPVTICLGPLADDETPIAFLVPGCLPPSPCFEECPPAAVSVDPTGWHYNPATGQWCLLVIAQNDGCACFCLEDILSAEAGSFAAVARDNSVELTWTTLSESNVNRFEVLRKVAGHEAFELAGMVEATNTATGSSYTFVDHDAVNGTTYEYTLETLNLDGSREAWGTVVTATPSSEAAVITEYALHQNYPNPFNPSTNLVYDVVAENNVALTVYNAMGQEVATLVNGMQTAGRHTVSFDASNLTSGLYFYTVKIGNEFTATKKMLLVK